MRSSSVLAAEAVEKDPRLTVNEREEAEKKYVRTV
jgi:hypothetical protein